MVRGGILILILNFTETTTYDETDIKIGLYIYNDGVEDVVIWGFFYKQATQF